MEPSAWLSVSSPKAHTQQARLRHLPGDRTPEQSTGEGGSRALERTAAATLTGARSATPKIRLSLYKGMEVASGERGCGLAGPRKETHAAQAARDLSSRGRGTHQPQTSRPHLTSSPAISARSQGPAK